MSRVHFHMLDGDVEVWGVERVRGPCLLDAHADAALVGPPYDAFVMNLVPLAFFGDGTNPAWAVGENVTPDDLDMRDRDPIMAACRDYFVQVYRAMRPEFVIAVGRWTERTVSDWLSAGRGLGRTTLGDPERGPARVLYLGHPSPRNGDPAGWVAGAVRTLGPVVAALRGAT